MVGAESQRVGLWAVVKVSCVALVVRDLVELGCYWALAVFDWLEVYLAKDALGCAGSAYIVVLNRTNNGVLVDSDQWTNKSIALLLFLKN